MPIDWFTIIAQAINFLLLLWLLKRFLYKPIMNGLDARESKIAGILAEAESTKTQAQLLQGEYEQKLATISVEAKQVLSGAKEEAEITAKTIIEEGRQSADILVKKRLEALRSEVSHLKQDVLQKSVHEVYAISRKVLGDLADKELESMMFEKLLQRLETLGKQQKTEFESALLTSGNEVLVRSVFSLSKEQLTRLQQCLQNKFSAINQQKEIKLTQSLVPELISGIELTLSGWKISWSAHNYLNEFQKRLEESLKLSSRSDGQTVEQSN